MKRYLLTTALALCLGAPAYADNNSGPNCNGNGSCGSTTNNTTTITNAPVANGGTGGQGGKGGDASAAAIAGANSSSKSGAAAIGINENSNRNDNRSSAKQDQDQAQVQAQEQGQSVTWVTPRAPVSTASAAALATSSEACMGSTSIGGQGVSFGLSFGTTWENEDCTLRKRAGLLYAVGAPEAAKELLCGQADIRAAYLAAGKPCAADRPAVTPVAQAPVKSGVEIVGMSTPVPN